jgi:hypothetical protein
MSLDHSFSGTMFFYSVNGNGQGQAGFIWQAWSDQYHIFFSCRVPEEFSLLSCAVAIRCGRGNMVAEANLKLDVCILSFALCYIATILMSKILSSAD